LTEEIGGFAGEERGLDENLGGADGRGGTNVRFVK
jgi:hypothetical protein